MCFANIFTQSVAHLSFAKPTFGRAEVCHFDASQCINFFLLLFILSLVVSKKSFPNQKSQSFILNMFYSRSFIDSAFTFMSMIHFELIFMYVYDMR